MLAYDIVRLARMAERLRFRIDHHLGGDPARLEGLLADLNQLNPWHPVALTDRARRALPETFGPPLPPSIAPCARLFQQGRVDEAAQAAESVPEAALVRVDLALLRGDIPRAVSALEEADAMLGDIAVVRTRSASVALAQGHFEHAWSEASRALATNPLYGIARVVHGHVASRTQRQRISLPVRSPVRLEAGHAHYPSTLSPRARAAWRAWAKAREGQDLLTIPPGSVAHAALLAEWRRQPEEPAFYREDPNAEIEALDRWDREGLLAAYQWSTGLSYRNADAYRQWHKTGAAAMLAFWSQGMVQPARGTQSGPQSGPQSK